MNTSHKIFSPHNKKLVIILRHCHQNNYILKFYLYPTGWTGEECSELVTTTAATTMTTATTYETTTKAATTEKTTSSAAAAATAPVTTKSTAATAEPTKFVGNFTENIPAPTENLVL